MAVRRHTKRAAAKQQRYRDYIKRSPRRSGIHGKRTKKIAARIHMKQYRRRKKVRARR